MNDTEEPIDRDVVIDDISSLAITSDVHPKVLQGFLNELPSYTGALACAIEQFRITTNPMQLRIAYRLVHHIRGLVRVVNIAGLVNLMQYLEKLITSFGETEPTQKTLDVLQDCADSLVAAAEFLTGKRSDPVNLKNVLFNLIECSREPGSVQLGEDFEEDEQLGEGQAHVDIFEQVMQSTASKSAPDPSPKESQVESKNDSSEEDEDKLLRIDDGWDAQVKNALDQKLLSLSHSDPADRLNLLSQIQENLFESLSRVLAEQKDAIRQINVKEYSTQSAEHLALASRFDRVCGTAISQLAKTHAKAVNFSIVGENWLPQFREIRELESALLRCLKNSVEHGIEVTEKERVELNKSPQGNVCLHYWQSDEDYFVACEDDGSGFDYERLEYQILNKQSTTFNGLASLNTLNALLINTEKSADNGSGKLASGIREINTAVQALGGDITLESSVGYGSSVRIRLPKWAVDSRQIVFETNGGNAAVLASEVDSLETVSKSFTAKVNKRGWAEGLLGEGIQFMPLYWGGDSQFLDKSEQVIQIRAGDNLLVVQYQGKRVGLVVDKILGIQNENINPLPKWNTALRNVLGFCRWDTVNIVPVLNLKSVFEIAADEGVGRSRFEQVTPKQNGLDFLWQSQKVLIVIKDFKARNYIARLAKDLPLQPLTARSGFEAAKIIDRQNPRLIVVDRETLKQNGTEFIKHFCSSSQKRFIVALALEGDSSDKSVAKALGVDLCIKRCWRESDIRTALQTALSELQNT